MVFTVESSLESAITSYADFKSRLAKFGRDEDAMKVLHGVAIVVGQTKADARDKLRALSDTRDNQLPIHRNPTLTNACHLDHQIDIQGVPMAKRPNMPLSVEEAILIESRRRCCICFALERDPERKPGQIAHLDRNRANHDPKNLAFLCLTHHDEYDTRTSQSKGFKKGEVKQHKEELLHWLRTRLSQETTFGVQPLALTDPTNEPDPYAGYWKRVGDVDGTAEIEIVTLPLTSDGDERYFASGLCLQGFHNPKGGSWGEFDFYAKMEYSFEGDFISYTFADRLALRLTFVDGHLRVWEDSEATPYSAGVNFAGIYSKFEL